MDCLSFGRCTACVIAYLSAWNYWKWLINWNNLLLGLSVIAVILHLTNYIISTYYGVDMLIQARQNIGLLRERMGWFLIPAVWLIIPVLEELMFRLTLIKSRKNLRAGIFSVCIYLGLTLWIGDSSNILEQFIVPMCSLKFIGITYSGANSKLMFYSSVWIFGLLHISSYTPFIFELLPFYLIFVLPQLFMGLVLGYVRVKMGILYAILLHVIINTPVTLSLLLY